MLIRKFILFIASSLILNSCAVLKPADGVYNFEIYATNDLHGRYFDSLYVGSGIQKYSLASVSSYINSVRDTSIIQPILLDIGDNLQGDNASFYYNFIDTNSRHVFSDIVTYMKYDAIIVGNHDIETGHKVYDKIVKEIKVPYMAANAINTSTGKPYFVPYTIINRGNLKIAVLGMTNPNIKNWLSQDLWNGIEFKEIIEPTEYWIKKIKKREKPQIIVLATHTGLGELNTYSPENASRYAASKIEGIDLVLAAHDHQTANEKIKGKNSEVLLLESGNRASALSKAKINLVIRNGKVVSKNLVGDNVKMENIPADPNYKKIFKTQFEKIKTFTNQKVGVLEQGFTSRDAFFGPSEYLSLIHKVQLSSSGADISFAAPLSFDITVKAGELNFQDMLNIYPFENQLYVMKMSGKEILDYLEYSYSQWVYSMNSSEDKMLKIQKRNNSNIYSFINRSYNFDSASGILYEVDLTKPIGHRVMIKSMSNGTSFDLNKTYNVALSSYRANGGGEILEMGSKLNATERDKRVVKRMADIRDLLFDYIKKEQVLKPLNLKEWSFTPIEFSSEAKKREYQLIFPK